MKPESRCLNYHGEVRTPTTRVHVHVSRVSQIRTTAVVGSALCRARLLQRHARRHDVPVLVDMRVAECSAMTFSLAALLFPTPLILP